MVAITELKVNQLAEYRRERLADASFLMNAPGYSELAFRVLGNPAHAGAKGRHQPQVLFGRLELWGHGLYRVR